MDAIPHDVRHSVRVFLKSPGFTITAVAALALGIGATSAIFSVVNAVLLKPPPVADPDRLVLLTTTGVSEAAESGSQTVASPAKFQHWRAQSGVIREVSAFHPEGAMNYTGGQVVEPLQSAQASSDFFPTEVRNMVVRQGMSLALAGVVTGLGAAWGLSRLIESFLFGVNGRDPAVFAIVPAVLGAVALLAVWLPASRASRLNPVDSLRHE